MDFRAPLGWITRYEISDFVWDFYVSLTEQELDAIIWWTDTDEDEAMNYNEFAEVVGTIARPLTAPIPVSTLSWTFYDPYLRSYVYDPLYYPYYYRETLRSSPVRAASSFYYSPVRRTYSPIWSFRESSPVRHTYVSPYWGSRVESFYSTWSPAWTAAAEWSPAWTV